MAPYGHDFDTQLDRMTSVATSLGKVPDNISDGINELMNTVKAYVDLNKGVAATAYATAQQEWNQGMETVRAGAQKSGPLLMSIAQNIQDGDLEASQIFV
ncbi:WXG100 family type VII secretion target [Micromonospora sp. NPDC049559]|uniref:WXG100 family type VII secretion target n=1 Tax=Micromonospora sp. NPDC049559 TaxID=3155923 RepID=UPI0034230531